MTFSLDAVAEPTNSPPRVAVTATESDPELSIQSALVYRDGVPLRFDAAVTGNEVIAYDYDAPFDSALLYRVDGTELGSPIDWTETWASLAAWSGDTSGWSVASGVASSSVSGADIYRDTSSSSNPIVQVSVVSPSNLTLKLVDLLEDVVVSVLVSPDGTVTISGSTATKITGSGSFTLSLAEDTATIDGSGWGATVAYTGVPTRVRLVGPQTATFLSKFGAYGSGDGQLNFPAASAVDGSGNVYVADTNNHRVQKFNSSGVYQSQFGTLGSGDGQFNVPAAIAIDGSGNIWVVDSSNNRVQKFNSSGVFQSKFGTGGAGDGQFNQPFGIAIDGSGNVFVADSGNNRVQKFNSSGVFQSKFGTVGSGDGQFNFPVGIAIDGSGNTWVVDYSNNRVQKFNSSGVFQSKFGTVGSGDGQFNFPTGIAIDGSGNIWVTDSNNNRVQKFNSSGVFQSKFGDSGTGDGQFDNPFGIAIDGSGNLWVTDTNNKRVQKFTTTVGSTDDIAIRIDDGDGPIDVTASDTATLTPTGAAAGAWLVNTATPDVAILADTLDCENGDYYIVTDTRETTTLEENTVTLLIEGSADVVTVPLGPRRREQWTLNIACKTDAARLSLLAVLANSAPVSLRLMAAQAYLGLADGFYAVGRVTTVRGQGPAIDPQAIVSMPLTPARPPKFKPLWTWNIDALTGTGMSIDDVMVEFATINDLLVGP